MQFSRSLCVLPLLLGATACGFSIAPGGAAGDAPDTSDGGVDASATDAPLDGQGPMFVPVHVPIGGQAPGSGDLVLAGDVDTTSLTIGGSATLPAGVVFDAWAQPGGGAALAVLHVRGLMVPAGTIRVSGTRALVVVASQDIVVEGVLDGRARRDAPGPGGAPPDMGAGRGNPGAHVDTFRDSGGSGAGFTQQGGIGGGATGCPPTAPTISAGTTYGDATLTTLIAGSGGGTAFAASCGVRPAGAGGGAIQLSSATRVTITGGINVGGGGGGGGPSQGTGSCNIAAGSGGGSGGAIFLQAPRVEVAGTIAANGGGGGSSGGDPDGNGNQPGANGVAGQDGALGASSAAPGPYVGIWSAAGGGGGGRTLPAGGGATNDDCDGNGGGGGGSVGRVVIAVPPTTGTISVTGTDSPAHVPTTY